MKSIFILVFVFILSFGTVRTNAQTVVFLDVPAAHWAHAAIEQAYRDGIIYGTYADGSSGLKYFSPAAEVTGAEFLTIIGRAFYPEEMQQYESQAVTWYQPAEIIAQKYNLMYLAGGVNHLHRMLNRYEMAAIICNMLRQMAVPLPDEQELAATGQSLKIGDYQKISGWHNRQNVATVFHLGILTGVDEAGTFAGQMHITRAQTLMIYRKLADFLNQTMDFESEITSEFIPAGPVQSPADKKREEFKTEVLRLINEERSQAKLEPLTIHQQVESLAQVRANEITQLFSHTRPNGQDTFTIIKEAGIDYRYLGENIAAGHSTPQAVVNAWMKSEGHRANILSDKFTEIGIGYVNADTEYKHYWVQFFIEPKSESIKNQ